MRLCPRHRERDRDAKRIVFVRKRQTVIYMCHNSQVKNKRRCATWSENLPNCLSRQNAMHEATYLYPATPFSLSLSICLSNFQNQDQGRQRQRQGQRKKEKNLIKPSRVEFCIKILSVIFLNCPVKISSHILVW